MENMEMIIMNLIVDAGSARSYAMEAIGLAKNDKFEEAKQALENANMEIVKAHKTQTSLIQEEARGNHMEISLFMVHAQDHIMTAMLAKELAGEIVELHEKMKKE
jgi:PTS system cellobiose-specific IIA component